MNIHINKKTKTIGQIAREIESLNGIEYKIIEELMTCINDLYQGCIFCDSGAKIVRIGKYGACRACIERLKNANDGDFLYPI
ncbi:MAG: hypothetical protein LBC86_10925 [Oscillospiraceae bacterium]|jgi:predicted nucleic acid-binding Zn ribbon protein|nr:hypothetical protein [Oscillospiraceae bacterium]